jgi:DNA polymerase elongation subunit (family B)
MYGNVYYHKRASTIYWSEYDEDGTRNEHNKKWVPDFYVDSKDEDSEFHTQSGKPLKRVVCNTFGERKRKIKEYKDCMVGVYGSDLTVENKFLLENWEGDITGTPSVWVTIFDIETECESGFPQVEEAKERINLVTFHSSKDQKYYVFALKTDYSTDDDFNDDKIVFKLFDTEEEMLKAILSFFEHERFDVISGWNTNGFDTPYFFNRVLRVLDGIDLDHYNELLLTTAEMDYGETRNKLQGEINEIKKNFHHVKRLSPYGVVNKRIKLIKDPDTKEMKSEMVYSIEGLTDYDYLALDKLFRQNKRDSYKLDEVANDELGERKIEYDGSLKDLYTNDWNLFVKYNIKDTYLVVRLDEEKGYIDQAIALSYRCHCRFSDNFGTVQKVETAIYNFLKKDGLILDDRTHSDHRRIPGGYVTKADDLRRGFCHWVIDVDIASLYPSIMRGLNLSYDTKIAVVQARGHLMELDGDAKVIVKPKDGEPKEFTALQVQTLVKKKGYQVTANNVILENLERKRGILTKILDMWYNQRKADKKLKADYRTKALECFRAAVEHEDGTLVEDDKQAKKLGTEDLETYRENMRQMTIYHNKQWSCKILLNSVYGCLASQFFRYHDFDLASGVTLSGQSVIKANGTLLNDYFNKEVFDHKVVQKNFTINHELPDPDVLQYQDTDSCYLTFEKLMDKMNVEQCDEKRMKVTKFLSKLATNHLAEFAEEFFPRRFNAENTIFWDQELIARTGIWCKPKKYMCYVLEEDGEIPKDPLLKKGLDIVRSSIPRKFKVHITEAAVKMMTGASEKEICEYILDVYKTFKDWTIHEIAIPSSCNNIKKYSAIQGLDFLKGSPQHMKSAVAYNFFIEKEKLAQYDRIKEGDKFSLIFLAKNNMYPVDTIGYKEIIPKELELELYIDKDQHFVRGFIKPLTQIFDAVGWTFPQTKNATEDIEDLFE